MTPIRPKRLFRSGRKRRRVFSQKKRKRIRSIVKKTINKDKEWKFTETVVSTTADTNGTVGAFLNPLQGTDQNQRIGEKIHLGSLRLWFYWRNADIPQTCRFIVFQWFPQTAPVVDSILDDSTGSAPYHHYDTEEAQNYKILYDKFVTINSNDGSSVKQYTSRRLKIKPGRRICSFLPSTSTCSNRMYYLIISDSGAVTHPSFYMNSRVYFRE